MGIFYPIRIVMFFFAAYMYILVSMFFFINRDRECIKDRYVVILRLVSLVLYMHFIPNMFINIDFGFLMATTAKLHKF